MGWKYRDEGRKIQRKESGRMRQGKKILPAALAVSFGIIAIIVIVIIAIQPGRGGRNQSQPGENGQAGGGGNEDSERKDLQDGSRQNGEDRVPGGGKEIRLAVAADLHYLAEELTDGGDYFQAIVAGGDGKQLFYRKEILLAFLQDMEELRPDAVLLAGDLTLNGELASHTELATLLSALPEAGIPVYVVPGNHDVGNLFARRYVGQGADPVANTMPEDFVEIYRDYGYGKPDTDGKPDTNGKSDTNGKPDTNGSPHMEDAPYVAGHSPDGWSYLVRLGQVSLYMLNTNRFQEEGYFVGDEVKHETLVWMNERLLEDEAEGRIPVAVGHHNLLTHNPLFTGGYTLSNSTEAKNIFALRGLPLYLSGHMHIQHEAKEAIEIGGSSHTLWEVVGSSLLVNPHQYGLVTISADGAITYETKPVQVEKYAAEQGLKDENLLHFQEYAREFYYENSYAKAVRSLKEADSGLTEIQQQEMADFAARINVDYFAGMDSQTKTQYQSEAAWEMWKAYGGDSFWVTYMETMLE